MKESPDTVENASPTSKLASMSLSPTMEPRNDPISLPFTMTRPPLSPISAKPPFVPPLLSTPKLRNASSNSQCVPKSVSISVEGAPVGSLNLSPRPRLPSGSGPPPPSPPAARLIEPGRIVVKRPEVTSWVGATRTSDQRPPLANRGSSLFAARHTGPTANPALSSAVLSARRATSATPRVSPRPSTAISFQRRLTTGLGFVSASGAGWPTIVSSASRGRAWFRASAPSISSTSDVLSSNSSILLFGVPQP